MIGFRPVFKRRAGKVAVSTSKRSKKARIGYVLKEGRNRAYGPDSKLLQFIYAVNVSVPAGAATGTQVMNLNSLFDPDRTGAGAQPNGFDEWSAIYNRYVVYKAEVEWVYAPSTANSQIFIATCASNVDSDQNIITIAGLPFSTMDVASQAGGNIKRKITYKLWEVNGKSFSSYMADDRFQALTSASPGELIVWRIRAEIGGGGTGTGYLQLRVRYFCKMFDKNQLLQS